MPKIRMRLLPANGFSYSRSFHILFSTLCKEIKRTSGFYSELAKVRDLIKKRGIEEILNSVESSLSQAGKEYFVQMKEELPKVGQELQAKCLTYLLSLPRDKGSSSSSSMSSSSSA